MSFLKIERRGAVAVLTIDRPDSLNALGLLGDGAAFRDACESLASDTQVRCVVLTGAGRAFSAGGDVKAMRDKRDLFAGGPAAVRENYRREVHGLVRALRDLDLPLIAAVNGPAVGLGCDVACLADIRIASDQARFGVTFLKLGLIPGDGGAWLLPRVVGHSRAAEMLFTGELVDAATAAEWGLVSRVVPHERLMEEALALADRIAAQPPQALKIAKSLLREGRSAAYDSVMEMSASAQAVLHESADHAEGVAALLEKRTPQFEGR